MFMTFFSSSRALTSKIMDHRLHLAEGQPGGPAHWSSPPLQAAFRLPRLPRDVETVLRPRTPLRPAKWEVASDTYAVVEFGIGRLDEVQVKEEAEDAAEAPLVAEEEREFRAQFATLRVAPPAPAADSCPRKPGRPKGSKSRPRVAPQHNIAAPPERKKAREASAKITAMKR